MDIANVTAAVAAHPCKRVKPERSLKAPYPDTDAGALVVTPEEAAAYVAELEEAYRPDRPSADPSVAIVDGEGVAVRVRNGHLDVSDGEGWLRRQRTYNRATLKLRRLVVTAGSGMLTLDALRWCHEAGVVVVVLDDDDVLLAQSPVAKVDSRVLRVQAAPPDGLAVEAARTLLGAKLTGQANVARTHLSDDGAAASIMTLCQALADAQNIDQCRQHEASAANIYWLAWEGHPATTMRFARADAARVPAHWSHFAGRSSPLTGGNYNRRAATPVNACLNYLYKVASLEVRLALVRVGLHPSLGFVHLDEGRRENLVWDVLETVRPHVDTWLLALLAQRTFRWDDFREGTDGSVTIAPALCHDLAGTMPRWAKAVAPQVERLYHLLGRAVDGKWEATTPLTRAKSKTAAAQVKARKAAMSAIRREERAKRPTLWSCPDCGAEVTDPRRVRCDSCIDGDPRQAPALRKSRARAISARKQAESGWSRKHHPGTAVNRRWAVEELRPALRSVKLSEIVKATGVAKSTASGWRLGHTVPHPMHWRVLCDLAGVELVNDSF